MTIVLLLAEQRSGRVLDGGLDPTRLARRIRGRW
jgi:hypothetical protein